MSIINSADHIGLVYSILKRLRVKTGDHVRDDCESAGMHALVVAAEKFKPGSAKFSSYAYLHIWGAIVSVLKKQRQYDNRLFDMSKKIRHENSYEEKDVLCEQETLDVFDRYTEAVEATPYETRLQEYLEGKTASFELNGRIICMDCKRPMIHKAKRLCSTCYKKTLKNEILCKGCKKNKKHHAGGYCVICYHKNFTNIIKCSKCNKMKRHSGKGMCKVCYYKHKKPSVICVDCGKEKGHEARGRCRPCYNHYRRKMLISVA